MTITPNYCLLDAARMDEAMLQAKDLNDEHHCLYEGDSEQFLNSVAPFLFSFNPGEEFSRWLIEEGKGQSWGILFESKAEPLQIYRHLRKFLIIKNEDEKELYFRFYDPRVLRVFLPTCNDEQLYSFFGPIETFITEDENQAFTSFSLQNGELHIQEGVTVNYAPTAEDEYVLDPPHYSDPVESEAPLPPAESEDTEESSDYASKEERKIRWDFGY